LKEVEKLADDLCEKEPTYLNMNIISRDQVFELLKKLYKSEYKCDPPVDNKTLDTAAPGAPAKSAAATAKAKEAEKSEFSDNYDDDFGDSDDDKKAKDKKAAGKKDSDDDWGMDDDWGEPNVDFRKDEKPDTSKDPKKEAEDKKRQDMFFGGDKAELDDLPTIGGGDGEKNEDKFN